MLTIDNLSFSRNQKQIFQQFHLQIAPTTVTCILGSSGIGKTTLLKLIANLISPDAGFIGFPIGSLGYVFQEPRLLPSLTVFENIAWVDETVTEDRIDKLLEIAGLYDAKAHYPHQLSGGMKQRVSLIRAMVNQPALLLMDEPFQSLDIHLKNEMLQLVRSLWLDYQPTVILVTHDLNEALNIGQRILILGNSPTQIVGDFTRQSAIFHKNDCLKMNELLSASTTHKN
ncbi:ABC transporter ATP-binding protein [Lysinibacillus sp. NPDC047702]|uniref:ABC transporter ATP-binding protein n=1 Tax=unclassified Lysinibacillus TaxID=2636778 RepID=UPI003CFBECE3